MVDQVTLQHHVTCKNVMLWSACFIQSRSDDNITLMDECQKKTTVTAQIIVYIVTAFHLFTSHWQ